MPKHRRQKRPTRSRRGAVAVEFALTAPIAFLLFFAALEFGRVNMIRHSMENAAYEGARRGLALGATERQIRQAANTVLDAVAIRRADVDVDNDDTHVTVSITANLDDQSWVAPLYFAGRNLSTTLTITKDEAE